MNKVFAAVLTASAAGAGAAMIIKNKKAARGNNPLPDGFTVTAHTGAMGTKANSLRSITEGVKYGADIIEIDLQPGADGEPVLSHDTPKGGEVPLEDAFRLISTIDGLRVNLDIKNTCVLAKTQELAEKYGILDRVFCTGIGEGDVEAVKTNSPGLTYYLNTTLDMLSPDREAVIEKAAQHVIELGAIGFNVNKFFASAELAQISHKHGLKLSVWTLNKNNEIADVLAMGPDNITTRRPDRACRLAKDRT